MVRMGARQSVFAPLAIPFYTILKALNTNVPEIRFEPANDLLSCLVVSDKDTLKQAEVMAVALAANWRPIDHESRTKSAFLHLEKDEEGNYKNGIRLRFVEDPSEKTMIKVFQTFSQLQEQHKADLFFTPKEKKDSKIRFRGQYVDWPDVETATMNKPLVVHHPNGFDDDTYTAVTVSDESLRQIQQYGQQANSLEISSSRHE